MNFMWDSYDQGQPVIEDRWSLFTEEEQYAIMGAIRVLLHYHPEQTANLPMRVKLALARVGGELNHRVPVE